MASKKQKQLDFSDEKKVPVLKKHVGLIHCENRLTFLQRKICNVLLFNALDDIEKNSVHQITMKRLCNLVGYRSNDVDLIKKSIKTLITTILEWNLLDDNKFVNEADHPPEDVAWTASALLAGATIKKGIVHYSYSPQIKLVLTSLEIYGRINLFVQAKFNSSYSLALYENCVRFKNIGKTTVFDLELFRSLMGLTNGQYESFKELKRNVIAVAVKEINQKADIVIEPELQKTGRTVTGIRFYITNNEKFEPQFKRTPGETEAELQSKSSLLEILQAEFSLNRKQAADLLEQYDDQYLIEKFAIVRNSRHVENPGAYLIAALKNDYKENKTRQPKTEPGRGVQNTYLRETGEASQIWTLKKKYTEYKFAVYAQVLQAKGLYNKIHGQFITFLLQTNPVMGGIFKKKQEFSPPAMIEFMNYVDTHHADIRIAVLSFDDFLTQEEEVV